MRSSRVRKIAALVVAVGALLALAPGCRGVVLDLGPDPPGDPSCGEVKVGADLTGVSFGRGPPADCLRFFAQTAAGLDELMYTAELDVGAACDALAVAGGLPVSISGEVHARCDNAVQAITSSPAFRAIAPIAIRDLSPSTCTPGPAIPCGGCASCNEGASTDARASCTPATIEVKAVTPTSAASRAALASLGASLPAMIALIDKRDATFAKLGELLKNEAEATPEAHLDIRGAACRVRVKSLLAESSDHFGAAVAEATRVRNTVTTLRP